MLLTKIKSVITYCYIALIRLWDHSLRRVTGAPTMKRSEITPHLYLGGQYYRRGINTLKRIGITGIVNMREHSIKNQKGMEEIHHLHLPTKDLHAPSLADLKTGIAFIQQEIDKGGKVYVHCHWGEGRGPTMAIAYLISTGMLLEDAFMLVKQIRPFIKPTNPQMERLKELEKALITS